MTVEHDYYRLGEEPRNKMRKILQNNGYKLICSDVNYLNNPYEDWWVDPLYVDLYNANKYKCNNVEYTEILNKFIQ